jgi:hypothetical protein
MSESNPPASACAAPASPSTAYEPAELVEFSPLMHGLTRLFEGLRRCSPSFWLLQSRPAIQDQFASGDPKALTRARSRRVEAYIVGWLLLELGLVTIAIAWPPQTPRWWPTVLATWRLVDIFQASMNLTVFDRLRMKATNHYVASVARIAILSLWNYIEAIACFGIIYADHARLLTRTVAGTVSDDFDPFYFSAITQLTIGYGDMAPTGGLRAVAVTQGLLGFVLGVFAISRVIAFLPRTRTIIGDD